MLGMHPTFSSRHPQFFNTIKLNVLRSLLIVYEVYRVLIEPLLYIKTFSYGSKQLKITAKSLRAEQQQQKQTYTVSL